MLDSAARSAWFGAAHALGAWMRPADGIAAGGVVRTRPAPRRSGRSIRAPHVEHLEPRYLLALLNGDFAITDAADPQFGWTIRGSGNATSGAAVLTEDPVVISGFSQAFTIDPGTTTLRFTIVNAAFADNGTGNPPDAFEVALLNSTNTASLIGVAQNLPDTDALLNIQATGEVFFGPEVTVPGAAVSGNVANLTFPLVVTVDLNAVAGGTPANLFFDLIGFSPAGSTTSFDTVTLEVTPPPLLEFNLDPASDSGVPSDGITNRVLVDFVGTTDAFQPVQLDLDGDGFDDGEVTADATGLFRFNDVPLAEGSNGVRLAATSAVGTTIRGRTLIGDRVAPSLPFLDDILVESAVPAVVTFPQPVAVDSVDPNPTVVCNPPSGSTFPLARTVVMCTATDSAGNSRVASFGVLVEEPGLMTDVNVIGFTSPATDRTRIEILYEIVGGTSPGFEFAFFGSDDAALDEADAVSDSRVAVTAVADRTPGLHTRQIDATPYAPLLESLSSPFVLVVADPAGAITETDETNNVISFLGVFQRESRPSPLVIRGSDDTDRYPDNPVDVVTASGIESISIMNPFTVQPIVIAVGNITQLVVAAGGGADSITADAALPIPIRVRAGTGDDTVVGGSGNDTVVGEDGDDSIDGGNANDRIRARRGNDSVRGGAGDDELRGGRGQDTLGGGGGDDFLAGRGDDDTLRGGTGADTLDGGSAQDNLRGGGGNDSLIGETGDDILRGGGGDDALTGSAGLDSLFGGTGFDSLVDDALDSLDLGGEGLDGGVIVPESLPQ